MDSIELEIDTVFITIEHNNIQYEKDINTIISNNTSEDYLFYREYIESNNNL